METRPTSGIHEFLLCALWKRMVRPTYFKSGDVFGAYVLACSATMYVVFLYVFWASYCSVVGRKCEEGDGEVR